MKLEVLKWEVRGYKFKNQKQEKRMKTKIKLEVRDQKFKSENGETSETMTKQKKLPGIRKPFYIIIKKLNHYSITE